MKLNDREFDLLSTLTRRTKLDSVFDIHGDDKEDFFYDYEEGCRMTLKDGFELLVSAIVYSFQHEGFTDEESGILENLIQKFVPEFVALDPATD